MKRSTNKTIRKVSSHDGEVAIESGLPMPVVHYPGHYGAFFGFGESLDSPISICECSRAAIENYILYRLSCVRRGRNSDPEKSFILSKFYFPKSLVLELIAADVTQGLNVIDSIRFKEGICHECNKKTPSLGYCVPMYGGAFEQSYGWYINKQSFEFGVVPNKPIGGFGFDEFNFDVRDTFTNGRYREITLQPGTELDRAFQQGVNGPKSPFLTRGTTAEQVTSTERARSVLALEGTSDVFPDTVTKLRVEQGSRALIGPIKDGQGFQIVVDPRDLSKIIEIPNARRPLPPR